MALGDDVGSAFTGQSLDPATAADQWDSWLDRPGNRTALLQAGLQLMQPVAMGQTIGGHVAQAIGAGGEAAGRASLADERARIADAKLAQADEKLRIAQQNADSGAIRAGAAAQRATAKKLGGLTDAFRTRRADQMDRAFERQLDSDARGIEKAIADDKKDILNKGVVRSQYAKYDGMTRAQIRDALRAERPKPKVSTAAGEEDDDEDDTAPSASAAPTAPANPTGDPSARLAQNGKWYIPDPKNAGKWLEWR